MQTIIIRKRYGAEWIDVRELIQPQAYMVQQTITQLRGAGKMTVRGLWSWLLEQIEYPPGPDAIEDGHTEMRYHLPFPFWPIPRFLNNTHDFWNLPGETLRDKMGDCEDRTGLLMSMLAHLSPAPQAWFTVGYWVHGGTKYGHTWVSIPAAGGKMQVLETTLGKPLPASVVIYEGGPYQPNFRFNQHQVQIVSSGEVPNVHSQHKQTLISSAYRVVQVRS